jgi:small GTP-binding protein
MAMPHKVFKQKCIKEMKGLSGDKKKRKIDELLEGMSGYKSGPYADIRKWLYGQRDKAIVSKKIASTDSWDIKKQGNFTYALVGFPSVGKSSLIKKLTNAQIKVASYEFTTIKPFSSIVKICGAMIQLVDLPGIIEGAAKGKGLGRRILSSAFTADKIILVIDSTKKEQLSFVKKELEEFGELNKENCCVIFTKNDLGKAKTDEFPFICVSVFQENSMEKLKEFLFKEAGFMRVYPHNSNEGIVLKKESTIEEFCFKIHKGIVERFVEARISGPSAKFDNQKVGLKHLLQEGDKVELVLRH